MDWFEDVGNAVASVASAVGDAVEVVVETVTETAESVVDVVEDVVENVFNGVRDWVGANMGPVLSGIANVVLGLIQGPIAFVFDVVDSALHIVTAIGHLAADILRLDFAKVIADLANIGIGLLEILMAAVRFGLGGYHVGAIKENFDRDRGMNFIRQLLIDELGAEQAETALMRLGYGTARFGLRAPVDYAVLRMDSNSYPLAADHNSGIFDLFALAGVLSFKTFSIPRERTRVIMVDADGNDQWYLPVGRSVIQSFLDTGSPRLRVYAWENYAVSRAMRLARQKFGKLFIRLNFGWFERFSRFQTANIIDITSTEEYLLSIADGTYNLSRFLATRTEQDGELIDDFRSQAVGAFKFGSSGLNGVAVGIDIHRSDSGGACTGTNTTDGCITDILRVEGDYFPETDETDMPTGNRNTPCGRGVFHRDSFPPYFSKFVLAHEMGHHFGLSHAGHDGFQNIMFTVNGQDIWDIGLFKLYYQGEPEFQPEDLEHAWRFLVHKLPHVVMSGG